MIALALTLAAPLPPRIFCVEAARAGCAAAPRTLRFEEARGFGWEDPARFSVKVPEGNYRVTLALGGAKAAATTVKAEARRLMLEDVRTEAGAHTTRSFVVNVRTPALGPPPENAPGGSAVRLKPREIGSATWDDRLTLEFLGTAPQVQSIAVEPADVPTLYLAGDSTVTDQTAEPAASWGQMLTRFLGPDIAVANHAESGETLKSFLTELRLDKMLSAMKAGDFVVFQFGHNDQKRQWPQTYVEAATTYRAYLQAFIAEARRRGATPILATSPERRTFDAAGRIVPSHGDYPAAVRQVARETGVGLIDLTAATTSFYEALGPSRAPLAFNDGGKDKTHHNNYGAYAIARMVAAGLAAADPRLAAHVLREARAYDPARPAPPERFALPASGLRSDLRPDGN
ncbi:rhamnogalacturonan acetylesterase [Sphingosinicella sp. BN140058]|uniref:rhamnogalacturonan acetylesterase n=1 Tax=Sphingosinicella sp. BN140058 TaxID=1892855 RepID=UPI00101219B1|nr:rhamnogalacturonan acetylesterase [Sphingosinicella sp. BN140058]QAY76291.1 rhamnogalacturonan acetylesterase [Sphingosinicella sp. BN140058]